MITITGTTTNASWGGSPLEQASEAMLKNTQVQADRNGKKLPENIASVYKYDIIHPMSRMLEYRSREPQSLEIKSNLIATPFEAKMTNRWLCKFPKRFGILEQHIKSVNRRTEHLNDTQHSIGIEFYDPASISLSNLFIKIMKGGKEFKVDLEMVDPQGLVLETWKFDGCLISEINWSPLTYYKNELSSISLEIVFKKLIIK